MASIKERRASIRGALAERNAAIRGNLNERRASSQGRLDARRQRMEASLVSDLAEALPTERQQPALRKEQAKGSIPSTRGSVREDYQPGSSKGTGGIASPLIEGETAPAPPVGDPDAVMTGTPQLDRTYWPEGLKSSDGLFILPAIKELVMRDANGDKVLFQLADPSAVEEEAP